MPDFGSLIITRRIDREEHLWIGNTRITLTERRGAKVYILVQADKRLPVKRGEFIFDEKVYREAPQWFQLQRVLKTWPNDVCGEDMRPVWVDVGLAEGELQKLAQYAESSIEPMRVVDALSGEVVFTPEGSP